MANIMHEWFLYLFDSQKDKNGYVKCFECQKRMHEDTYKDNLCCYSHILSKKKYPQYAGKPWNVKIVHPDCHNLYSMRPSHAKNQYKEYLKLKNLEENGEI